ncbi:hypothetical protein STCU_00323 [Strigomonas culicis]|uniref:Uncharacterized protein n=1 Tax=Strigomonas culicis TaxID=28005 RepID=S9V7D0_9TRYP|nr:hypothetical protein STCU_00323 [Strigomonas culicis]|eukprot:EPY36954.1 hypothetical protein STCU_00323 [Strigomonas culicis]
MIKTKSIKCNKVMHLFPIKPVFAMGRIEKDVAEGKARYVPSSIEMEDLMKRFQETENGMKEEGWILDL